MSAASHRWLKGRIRALIKRCGGLEEASRACRDEGRRYSTSQLQRAQDVNDPSNWLPVDVVMILEAYCGQALVSQAMAGLQAEDDEVLCPKDETCDVVEGATSLLTHLRASLKDGVITSREADAFEALAEVLMTELRQAMQAVRKASEGASGGSAGGAAGRKGRGR